MKNPHPAQAAALLGMVVLCFAAVFVSSAHAQSNKVRYVVSTPTDAVKPGQVIEFDVTVTNNNTVREYVDLYYNVPAYTVNKNGTTAGGRAEIFFGYIAPGASATRAVYLTVTSGASAPPEGTPITLTVDATTVPGVAARQVVAYSAPALSVRAATDQASVYPGNTVIYTFYYNTVVAAPNAILRVPVPAYATVAGADHNAALGADNVVQWNLGSLPAGASGLVRLELKAATPPAATGEILVEAYLGDAVNHLARSSITTLIDSTVAVTYAMATTASPVQAGQVVRFDVTVGNNTAITQYVDLFYTVPAYTSGGSNSPANTRVELLFGNIPANTIQTKSVLLTINSGAGAPPNGTPITLAVTDQDRGVTMSNVVDVRSFFFGGAARASKDLNGDGTSDLLWQNAQTGERDLWTMNNGVPSKIAYFSTVPVAWQIAGLGDLNADGQTDLVWQNTQTGQRDIWLMNGAFLQSIVHLPTIPTEWQIAGLGDFNNDGQTDLVWQNVFTGERDIWLMIGTTPVQVLYLATIPTEWQIAAVGDLDGDGTADLLWQNRETGERDVWTIRGAQPSGIYYLGTIPTEWQIAGVGDFNGDGRNDLIWQNTGTGERDLWFLNNGGVQVSYLGTVPPVWSIANH